MYDKRFAFLLHMVPKGGSPFGNPGGEATRSPLRGESAERWMATVAVSDHGREITHWVFAVSL